MRIVPSGLMARFIALAGVVLIMGMVGLGLWVSAQVERIAAANAGATTALYVDAMVAPVVQAIEMERNLPPEAAERLAQILGQGALRREVSAFKLWNAEGRVVFSDRQERIGQLSADNPRLAASLSGQVSANLRQVSRPDLSDPDPLMEVYIPIRSTRTGKVIAVAEFYTTTTALREDLFESRIKSWLVVGAVTFAMFCALSTIFVQGERTIRSQRQTLDAQIAKLVHLLRQNETLTARVSQANRRSAEASERTLQRLSADIHDGPAQLMAFAAMRLDGSREHAQVAEAVGEALEDLRRICHGMVLPELQDWSVTTIARRLIGTHETRMGEEVYLKIHGDIPDISVVKKNCIYRFLQETLNNCARHAAGSRQGVVIRKLKGMIEVEVSDTGPGFDPKCTTTGLGLAGLRDRVLALDGRFELSTSIGRGTQVSLRLSVKDA
ncbi:Signal transduction histidine-protein kinase/phosphatase DegS [Marinibacterium anthonyi]|nr:Signal transduction histidine-protein kinase/phosphatase DegS [Marinibacterium anthonyi]